VDGVGATPAAVLFEFNFALHQFAVLATPIINPLALLAGQFD